MLSGVDPASLALCLAAILFSGILRGFSGFGFALAAAPLLGSILSPAQAMPVVLLLQIGASLIGLRGTAAALEGRSVLTLGTAAALASPVGVALLTICDERTSRLVIAALTLLSVGALYSGVRFAGRPRVAATIPFGIAAGIFSGLCAMPGPPVILYYMASPISNVSARASMISLFLLTGIVSLAGALIEGLVTPGAVWTAAFGTPAMIAGTWIGGRLFVRYHTASYRQVSALMLVAISAVAAWRALQG